MLPEALALDALTEDYDRTAAVIFTMERIRLERFSYRFSEQVLNSKLAIKHL